MMKVAEVNDVESLAIKPDSIIRMPLGLLGFERIKQYALMADPEAEPFLWFQVVEDPKLAFLVISPFKVLPDYQPNVEPEDVRFLELTDATEAIVYNIVTLRSGGKATINLKGPIIFNRRTMIGKQVILANAADYPVQHPLLAAS
jgi:flagellar assembly factor FliW